MANFADAERPIKWAAGESRCRGTPVPSAFWICPVGCGVRLRCLFEAKWWRGLVDVWGWPSRGRCTGARDGDALVAFGGILDADVHFAKRAVAPFVGRAVADHILRAQISRDLVGDAGKFRERVGIEGAPACLGGEFVEQIDGLVLRAFADEAAFGLEFVDKP